MIWTPCAMQKPKRLTQFTTELSFRAYPSFHNKIWVVDNRSTCHGSLILEKHYNVEQLKTGDDVSTCHKPLILENTIMQSQWHKANAVVVIHVKIQVIERLLKPISYKGREWLLAKTLVRFYLYPPLKAMRALGLLYCKVSRVSCITKMLMVISQLKR